MKCFDVEFRKGILFVRLEGNIDNNNYLKEVNSIIENIGIKYIVLNIDKIKNFNVNDINNIVNYNNKILKEKKKMLICDNHKNRNNVFNSIPNIKSEIEAFPLV
ncbi:MAG: hypothetical protein IJI49_05530 [Bacilli bacterium]|nr:hypothetical protein [Bacilli bacterium]